MFTLDALEVDYMAAYRQSATAVPGYASPLQGVPDIVAHAVSLSAEYNDQRSLTACATAWRGLDRIRAGLAADSIFNRASTVSLMVYEALLCACLESLAATHCCLPVTGDSDLV